jgi:hypothetical protein
MINHVIALEPAATKLLLEELRQLEVVRKALLKIIPETLLVKGSSSWWEKSDLLAQEEVEAGKYTKIGSHEELNRFLDKLE